MSARILPPTDESIALAAELLRAGEVVGMPTETVYGLAGNALDERAVARIFAVKERPVFDPLIVHVAPPAGAGDRLEHLLAQDLVDAAAIEGARDAIHRLISRFWPGPLTLVLRKRARVPDLVTSGLSRVAVRMPAHPVAQALIARAERPLAAPSANRFGRISPTSAADVAAELGDRIPLILDGGRSAVGVESTVVAVGDDGALTLLRPGGVPREALAEAAGVAVALADRTASGTSAGVEAGAASPGMLESHYAPLRPLILLQRSIADLAIEDIAGLGALPSRIGLLLQSGNADIGAARLRALAGREVTAITLSEAGDRAEAARNLFAALRALDGSGAELLLAEPCGDGAGLGHAIQDRLTRAATRRR